MKKLFIALSVTALLLSSPRVYAATTNDPAAELGNVVAKIQTKLQAGQKTEKDFAKEIKQFDALLAEHKGEKTEDVAQILAAKTELYLDVFDNTTKGMELLKQLKRDFPDTKSAKRVDEDLAKIAKRLAAAKIQAALAPGTKFPEFDEKDMDGKPLSLGSYKGKVVLVNFWATWCKPYIFELHYLIATYQAHHAEGFEIIGVNMDQDRQSLKTVLEQNDMPWPQFFDGQGLNNKLAVKYGVTVPLTLYLLDREGKIIGNNLRAADLETAVTKALAKK